MRVEVKGGTQARKLELDGYERSGKKTVRATLGELKPILDRDDVSVRTVKLHRQAGGDEAELIDEYIKAGVATDYGGSVSIVRFEPKTGRNIIGIRRDTTDILTADEDSLTVERMFSEAILDGPLTENRYDQESFESTREQVLKKIEEKVQSHEQSIDSLHAKREKLEGQNPEDV